MKNNINVTRSSVPDYEEYCEEIRDLWESRWLTNNGSKHQKLQRELETYLGVPNVVLYTNGHLALEHVLEAMELPAGGEVITTPFTFVSTTHAIVRCGLVPVFCDVNDRDYTMDAAKIEALTTDKTVAIVPVHVYGNLCDVETIAAIARKHNLKVVYDAAHAFGVKYRGVGCANFGDASMFSFHATKVFNTIEGGAITFCDPNLQQPLNERKNFGIRGAEDAVYVGTNAKMNEFQAAMGLCNLRHIEEQIEKRKVAVEHYRSRLTGVEGIRLCPEQPGVTSNYAYFPVIFDGYKWTRDQVQERLKQEGIFARRYFYPLTCDMTCYRGMEAQVPVARHLAECVLTLPLYADLKTDEIDWICDIIME